MNRRCQAVVGFVHEVDESLAWVLCRLSKLVDKLLNDVFLPAMCIACRLGVNNKAISLWYLPRIRSLHAADDPPDNEVHDRRAQSINGRAGQSFFDLEPTSVVVMQDFEFRWQDRLVQK